MTEFLHEWKDFNVAIVGATAALAGLVIVAASVNIGDIVKSRTLTARLGSGIVMLVLALVASASGLMPGIDDLGYGFLLLLITLIALPFPIATARLIATDRDPRSRARWAKSLIVFLPAGAYLTAAALAISGHPAGLFGAAIGALLAIIVGIVVSWVALVEVLR